MLPTIYFIRHGETDWNVVGRFQGQKDIPLNALGREQALRNGETLAGALPEAATLDFVASPLERSRDTMEIVRGALGLDPLAYRQDDRLKELTFGAWEGRTELELAQAEPEAHAAREADRWGFTPPEGESYALLAERVAPFIAGIERETLIVSHGGVMRVLRGLLCHVPFADVPHLETPQDRIMVIRDGTLDWL